MADLAAQLVGNFTGGGLTIPLNASNTGQEWVIYQHGVTNPTTNAHVAYAFTNSKVIAAMITCDQAVDLYTNDASGGSPTQHIPVAAATPQIYIKNVIGANPFSDDVTAGIYVTNASGSTANLTIAVLVTTP